jgi:hypothetical protein
MRRITALLLALFAVAGRPALAQEVVYETITEETVVEEVAQPTQGGERFVFTAPAVVPQGIAAFGPFRVLDDGRAALVAETNSASPAQFAAMLRAYPGIAVLEMVECPGTEDDSVDAPENRAYLDYYREMGMTPVQASAFYAMTNSVPNAQAKWLTAADLGKWVSLN